MNNLYFMSGRETEKPTYSIFPCKELGKLPYELIPLLEDKREFITDCYFKKISVGKDSLIYEDAEENAEVWTDYPANYFAWPIMSEKLKDIIESSATGQEGIDFIKLKVRHYSLEKIYYLLRFNKAIDSIDKENTLFVKDTDLIIKPVFRADKLDQYHIFYKPQAYDLWRISSAIYVTGEVKRAIIKSGIKDVKFSKARVV